MKYPLAPRSEWYGDADFEARGGRLTWMPPDSFLRKVRPLKLDDASIDNICALVVHVRRGGTLDPLTIYADGREDGRHRAVMAKRLRISSVPVLVFTARDTRRRTTASNRRRRRS